MNLKPTVSFIISIFIFLLIASENLIAMSCNNSFVSVGDSLQEVYSKCGEPVISNQWLEKKRIEKTYLVVKKTGQRIEILSTKIKKEFHHEIIYNFGPSRFLCLLQFKDKKLIKILTGGYGYEIEKNNTKEKPDQMDLEKKSVSVGDTKFDVIMKYGKPIRTSGTLSLKEQNIFIDKVRNWPRKWNRKKRKKFNIIINTTITTYRNNNTWEFDLGSNRLNQIIKFENDRVSNIRSGGYGN